MTLLKIALHLGLQHFVDIINYVDYKNTSISVECVTVIPT